MLDLQYHKEVSLRLMEQEIGAKLSQVSLWLQDHEQQVTEAIESNSTACDVQARVHIEILNYLDYELTVTPYGLNFPLQV